MDGQDTDKKRQRPAKKSETVEVRLSFEDKRAFREACDRRGVTVSQSVRAHITDIIDPPAGRRIYLGLSFALLCLIAAISLVFAVNRPQAASGDFMVLLPQGKGLSKGPNHPILALLDKNEDGFVSSADVAHLDGSLVAMTKALLANQDLDGDGRVTADELRMTDTEPSLMLRLKDIQPPDSLGRVFATTVTVDDTGAVQEMVSADDRFFSLSEQDQKRLRSAIKILTSLDQDDPSPKGSGTQKQASNPPQKNNAPEARLENRRP